MKTPFWAEEQLRLSRSLSVWVKNEIDKYKAQGFHELFGSKGGHALDEAGGYTRSFVGAYCLSGNEAIADFLKQFRDEWHAAVSSSGHMYHGYDANEGGDYITHTAEAFTQFLLNVLYLDPSDEKTISMVEDAAEHLGNWCPDVQDFYDWDRHAFRSYFLGTKSPYHRPPYDFQSPRHFRVLQIALAAYETTRKQRYLDLCTDYCDFWSREILRADTDLDVPIAFFMISPEEFEEFATDKEFKASYRFKYYASYVKYVDQLKSPEDGIRYGRPCIPASPIRDLEPPYHVLHDLVMTWLEIFKHEARNDHRKALKRLMAGWIALGPDLPSQLAGVEPHCGVHLPKYRDFTGDTSLDVPYLEQWPNGPCSYLLTGQEDRLTGCAATAEAVFAQALIRNSGRWGSAFATDHACNRRSNAGASSAEVAPALFLPVFGGLNVYFGRAPWVNVLYYANGKIGLPGEVAALYVPAVDGEGPGAKLANAGDATVTVGLRQVNPSGTDCVVLTDPPPDALIEVTLERGEVRQISF